MALVPDACAGTGVRMPAAAPLVRALASVKGAAGEVVDYTKLVDGYGVHIYPTSDTPLDMVNGATASPEPGGSHSRV